MNCKKLIIKNSLFIIFFSQALFGMKTVNTGGGLDKKILPSGILNHLSPPVIFWEGDIYNQTQFNIASFLQKLDVKKEVKQKYCDIISCFIMYDQLKTKKVDASYDIDIKKLNGCLDAIEIDKLFLLINSLPKNIKEIVYPYFASYYLSYYLKIYEIKDLEDIVKGIILNFTIQCFLKNNISREFHSTAIKNFIKNIQFKIIKKEIYSFIISCFCKHGILEKLPIKIISDFYNL